MTHNLAHNTRHHYQAPILNQFQIHLATQQQIAWQNFALNPSNPLAIATPSYAKLRHTP